MQSSKYASSIWFHEVNVASFGSGTMLQYLDGYNGLNGKNDQSGSGDVKISSDSDGHQ